MSTEYERFTNGNVEDGPQAVPPSHEKTSEVPINASLGYPLKQPAQYGPQQPGVYVYQQQAPGQQMMTHAAPGPTPKDYFGFALFVTICCCLPFGIVGLIKSSEVKNRAAMGDYNGATVSSAHAKRWSWAGCIVGGISWVIGIVVICIYIGLIVAACRGDAGTCDY